MQYTKYVRSTDYRAKDFQSEVERYSKIADRIIIGLFLIAVVYVIGVNV